jgi:DNA topoisomerase-1
MDKKTLIIVESPAKAKTIEKYLGEGYSVAASMGHLVDLPKSRLAVDVDNGFEPEYITIRGKAKILNALRQEASRSAEVLLASDNDREGEAISYHLRNAILAKKPGLKIRRIVFNEITPQVIRLAEFRGERPQLGGPEAVEAIIAALSGAEYRVADVRSAEKTLRPRAPLTTSKLQQEAANRFGFTSRKTMQIAQTLYEGVDVGSGRVGLITYMRTDSTRVSQTALAEVRAFLAEHYPQELPEKPVYYSPSAKAQDAHEAIRPTYVQNTPQGIRASLTPEQYKLYALIWERFVSSQMTPAQAVTTTADIRAGEALFRASSTRISQPGFQRVLSVLATKEQGKALPALSVGEALELLRHHPEQHFTAGPARYTDATIVKALEEKGIGRPSTYAPIISVLLDRYYVVRKSRQLVPTQLGRIINNLLTAQFPDLLDENFTATLESRLDEVEEQRESWGQVVGDFYRGFKAQVDHVMETLESIKGVLDKPTDLACEKCGRPMVKKLGRYGFFLACTGFPECRNTKAVPLADCPKPGCGGKIIARRRKGGRGKEFYGCTNYPECDFVTYYKPSSSKCPQCGHFLVEKQDKQRGSYKACINPQCNYLHTPEGASGPEGAAEAGRPAEAEDQSA